MKINTISISDPSYPERLTQIAKPPAQLYTLGSPDFSKRAAAIVGSRHLTNYGREVTVELAEKLAARGVAVVSGLALGADGLAHQGALNVGGHTIAVLANGLDRVTPSSHRELAKQILAGGGALLSEYEAGTPSLQWQFLARNRLVSGLSDAVIVTEASAKSGTMNTVMHALQQGRDVYAVPGNITSPMSSGCNKLIEQGASPIIDIDAFVEQFAPLVTAPTQQLLLAENDDEQVIIELLQSGVRDGDELLRRSKLDTTTFSTTMTMLELRSVIRPLGANNWSL